MVSGASIISWRRKHCFTHKQNQVSFITSFTTIQESLVILFAKKDNEAIENTIGSVKQVKKSQKRSSRKSSQPVLGQLMSDKIYLENLLKNPDLAIADKKNDIVIKQAEEALRFLENREEFWRQQQTAKRN